MAVTGEAVFVVNPDWTIVYASSQAGKLFRRGHGALHNTSIFSLMPERIRDGQEKLWKSVPDAGECLRIDTLGLRGKEEEFPLKVELARIPGHQLLSATLRTASASDLQNRQSQKMEALGLLAGGVAHDFNNALTAIIGFTESVKDELVASPLLSDDLQEVLNAAREAGELTKQLLSFARRRPVESAIVELNMAVGEIENLLRRTLPASIDLRVIPSSSEINVCIASTELHQIIINLATNAHHAMPRGGTLEITLARDAALDTSYGQDEYATVTVRDTGSGISEDHLTRIFDPFFSTKGEEGTGLGLSTCFGIATQAGGSLSVDSTLGEGTCFTLRIPTSNTLPVRLLTTTQRVDIRRHKGIALVVEDQTAIRKYMARVIGGSGLEVEVAASAEEAIEIFAALEQPLDLLLTDSMLPGMSGQELAKTLQQTVPNLRVVLTSGHLSPDSDPASVFGSNMLFLAKPFTAIQLRRTVDNLLDPPRKLLGKILVIGTSQSTANDARSLLRDVGHEITILASVAETLQHLQHSPEPPSLILLDDTLSALATATLIGVVETSPLSKLPVIFLTDPSSREVTLPGHLNCSRLSKPLSRGNLSAALAKLGLELS